MKDHSEQAAPGEKTGNLNQQLANELVTIVDPETKAADQPNDRPLELLAKLGTEAGQQPHEQEHRRGVNTESLAAMQQHVLDRLQAGDLGNYADLPAAITDLGPRLLRRDTLDSLHLPASERAVLASLIVLHTMPEGFQEDRVPKPKHETQDHAALRNALILLRRLTGSEAKSAYKEMRDEELKITLELKAAREQSEHDRLNTPARDLYQDKQTQLAARVRHRASSEIAIRYAAKFLDSLRDGDIDFTKEEAAEAFRRLQANSKNEPTPEAGVEAGEVESLDWVILPPDEREPIEASTTRNADDVVDVELRRYQAERIAELHNLVRDWGEGYVAESQFHSGGGEKYYVAILPQELPNGTKIEHAVADNAEFGNARFAFRADRNLRDEDGQPLTWQRVFGRHKTNAQRSGAKKIVHRGDWETRTVNYLTSDAAEL